jgi:hypothetical protein
MRAYFAYRPGPEEGHRTDAVQLRLGLVTRRDITDAAKLLERTCTRRVRRTARSR